jgi:hypothetical protein
MYILRVQPGIHPGPLDIARQAGNQPTHLHSKHVSAMKQLQRFIDVELRGTEV